MEMIWLVPVISGLVTLYLFANQKNKDVAAERKCPACFGSVNEQATKCMHCGSDLTS